MRCLSGLEWGASRSAMKNVHTALIKFVLDYASFVYGSAAKTSFSKVKSSTSSSIDIVMCCGVVKSTPVGDGEMPM